MTPKLTTAKLAFTLLSTTFLIFSGSAIAQDSNEGRFYGKIYGGVNVLGDESYNQTGVATAGATGDSSFDTGMMAGAAAGYFFTDNIAAEIAWDYRRNDSDSNTFSDGTNFSSGDYASNIFFLNGYYHFNPVMKSKFRPYLGAGLGYVQEIDLDLEAGGVETSYSSDGEVAAQLIAGTSYALTKSWDLTADVRYVRAWGMDLKQENGTSQINDIDYDPVSVTFGAVYKF